MSKLTSIQLKSFRDANSAAYKAAKSIFASIEAKDYIEDLATQGIIGSDVRLYAVIYVADTSGVQPYVGKGDTLTFKKDSKEYNRVKYLMSVINGKRGEYVANSKKPKAKKAKKAFRMTREARTAAKALLKLFDKDINAAIRALREVA